MKEKIKQIYDVVSVKTSIATDHYFWYYMYNTTNVPVYVNCQSVNRDQIYFAIKKAIEGEDQDED